MNWHVSERHYPPFASEVARTPAARLVPSALARVLTHGGVAAGIAQQFPELLRARPDDAMDSGKPPAVFRGASPIGVPASGTPAGSAWSSLFEPKRFEYPAARRMRGYRRP